MKQRDSKGRFTKKHHDTWLENERDILRRERFLAKRDQELAASRFARANKKLRTAKILGAVAIISIALALSVIFTLPLIASSYGR